MAGGRRPGPGGRRRPGPSAARGRWPARGRAPTSGSPATLEALGRRRGRRGRRLHRGRRRPGARCRGAPSTACTPWSGRPGSAATTWPAARAALRRRAGQRRGGAQLRHRGGAPDAVLRAGRPVHGRRSRSSSCTTTHKRDAPSGTAIAHGADGSPTPAGRPGRPPAPGPDDRDRARRAPAGRRARAGCGSTRSACPAWSPTRRCVFGAARPEPHHPPRLLRPALVHARGAPGRAAVADRARADRRPRPAARALSVVRRPAPTAPDGPRADPRRPTYDCVARWGWPRPRSRTSPGRPGCPGPPSTATSPAAATS